MRIAIFSITSRGHEISEKISKIFPDSKRFEKLDSLPEIFRSFDALIFICAVGIVVRKIAPLIQNKLIDPAVIVLDERARNVISLLSGQNLPRRLERIQLSPRRQMLKRKFRLTRCRMRWD